jgi:hypothetical protein
MNSRHIVILNFLGYQLTWFASVVGAAHGAWWLGPAIAVPLLVLHLRFAKSVQAELSLLIASILVGCTFDQVLLSYGWVEYPASPLPAWLLPLWMVALWASFATTLNFSMRWLKQRPIASILFGAIGGPLAYGAGARLGATSWNPDRPVAITLGVGFALIVPALYKVSIWFDGYGEARE